MERRIEYYRTASGECPVETFLEGISVQDQKKVLWVLKLIEDLPRVPAEYFKKLVGTDDIWECRIRSGSNAYRIFSFFFRGRSVILTHGYSKKRMKTDAKEIIRAEACRRDFLKRHKEG